MYTICEVIYGVPLFKTDSVSQPEYSEEMQDLIDESEKGFQNGYSGNSDVVPCYFGVGICEFDECSGSLDLPLYSEEERQEAKRQYEELYSALSEDLKKEVDSFGNARPCIVFMTS